MSEQKRDDFWSKVGDALRARGPEAYWASRRARIMARVGDRRPSRVRYWVAVPALAAAALTLVLFMRGQRPVPERAPVEIARAPDETAPAPDETAAPPDEAAPPPDETAPAPGEEGAEEETPSWDARITAFEGEVTVFAKDEEEGVAAVADAPLEAGDHLETGADGRVELALSPESVMEFGPNASLTIGSLDEEDSWFDLGLGTLVAKLRWRIESGRNLRVRTPTSVAAVRGTEFGVSVSTEGDTTVGVFDEGKVAVSAADDPSVEETLIEARQEVMVPRAAKLKAEMPRGRGSLRVRKLERLRAYRGRVKHIRARQAKLRKAWKRMKPAQRRELRAEIGRRHGERLKNLSPEKRKRLKQRLRRRRPELMRGKLPRVKRGLRGQGPGIGPGQRGRGKKPGMRRGERGRGKDPGVRRGGRNRGQDPRAGPGQRGPGKGPGTKRGERGRGQGPGMRGGERGREKSAGAKPGERGRGKESGVRPGKPGREQGPGTKRGERGRGKESGVRPGKPGREQGPGTKRGERGDRPRRQRPRRSQRGSGKPRGGPGPGGP
ncbi:MAG: FecR domain-containing protein [Elusimicrobiota bacterium]